MSIFALGFLVVDQVEGVVKLFVAGLAFGELGHGPLDGVLGRFEPRAVVFRADVPFDLGVDRRELGPFAEGALGVLGEQLVVEDGRLLVVADGVIVVGGPERGVVGEGPLGVVEADVLEGLDGVPFGVEQRRPAVEAGLEGEWLRLGILVGQPDLGDSYSRRTSWSRYSVPGYFLISH